MTAAAALSLVVALGAAWLLTRQVLRFAVARQMLDVPNARSSHSLPTPRGGGLAIVVVTLAGIGVGALAGWVRETVALVLLPAGAAVAGISWLDDRGGVRPLWRMLVHTAAAVAVVYAFGPVRGLGPNDALSLGPLATVLSVIGLVWLTNLFNFMDGIDGLAGVEAVTVAAAAGAICLVQGDGEPAWLALLIAAASAGFLPWNWHPARIFLGDVGAVFLGFMLGAVAILSHQRGDLPALGWMLLLGVFGLDATLTLLRRGLRREAVAAAHRQHAYQRAVQAGASHARVSATVAAINLLLAALTCVALRMPGAAPWAYGAGAVLLAAVYLRVEKARPM